VRQKDAVNQRLVTLIKRAESRAIPVPGRVDQSGIGGLRLEQSQCGQGITNLILPECFSHRNLLEAYQSTAGRWPIERHVNP
jgi:hypothetical protein